MKSKDLHKSPISFEIMKTIRSRLNFGRKDIKKED